MCKYCQVYESVARYDYYCHPTYSCQLRRWQASEAWRTTARVNCQAMRVRPTAGAPEATGWRERLKVAGGQDASRPERFAG